jgi:hypothetical protein
MKGMDVLQSQLNAEQRYRVDGLGPGQWRPVWWDRSEVVFIDPAGGIKALIGLACLTEIGPAHLRYVPVR